MPDQTAIAFSVSQRAALLAWGAELPLGLGVRLCTGTSHQKSCRAEMLARREAALDPA